MGSALSVGSKGRSAAMTPCSKRKRVSRSVCRADDDGVHGAKIRMAALFVVVGAVSAGGNAFGAVEGADEIIHI